LITWLCLYLPFQNNLNRLFIVFTKRMVTATISALDGTLSLDFSKSLWLVCCNYFSTRGCLKSNFAINLNFPTHPKTSTTLISKHYKDIRYSYKLLPSARVSPHTTPSVIGLWSDTARFCRALSLTSRRSDFWLQSNDLYPPPSSSSKQRMILCCVA
jgi:hypothetical protein